MVKKVAVEVPKLLVRYHLVLELMLLLALVLQAAEDFQGHVQIFKIHCNLSKGLHGPVEAVKSFSFPFFDKSTKLFKDGEYG